MASRGIANFLNRLIRAHDSVSLGKKRRWIHNSVYEKNVETIPDDLAKNNGEYWAPHPQTGVFVPPTSNNNTAAAATTPSLEESSSVLNHKLFFRPLEDLELHTY